MTPSHSALSHYKKKGAYINERSSVIQFAEIPKTRAIIIDEIGMVDNDEWNFIYKCFVLGKRIYAFGDFNQLKPISGKNFNNQNWLDFIFPSITFNNNNYRNDFSKRFYDKLIKCDEPGKITTGMGVVKKYSTENYWEADYILAYHKKIVKQYNDLMCERLNINNKYDEGAKLILKTNNLRIKNIYNNFEFISKGFINNQIVFTNDIVGDVIIEKKELKNFDYGYARTVHSVQGMSMNSYYFAKEDLNRMAFQPNGNLAYTIVSRLKRNEGETVARKYNGKYPETPDDKRKDFDFINSLYNEMGRGGSDSDSDSDWVGQRW